MVLMAYYDVSTRYITQCPMATVQSVVTALVSPQGLRHSDGQLRSRSAFFMRKITESLREDSPLLLQSVGSFAGEFLFLSDPLIERFAFKSMMSRRSNIGKITSGILRLP